MLDKLLVSLRNQKSKYLNAKQGSKFEERINAFLKLELGLTRIQTSDVPVGDWKTIKKYLGNKLAADFIDVPTSGIRQEETQAPSGNQLL